MNRRLSPEEITELTELCHIILSDMTVDASEAAAFVLGLAGEAIQAVIEAKVIAVENDDPESEEGGDDV